MPIVTSYKVGDSLDINGLVIELKYNNGDVGYASGGLECTPTVLSTAGTQQITVTYSGKTCTFNVSVSEAENQTKSPAIKIQRPSTVSVNYGDTLTLHAKAYNMPEGAQIKWSVEGNGMEITSSVYGTSCLVTSKGNGTATITATVVDEYGVPVIDSEEREISAYITLESKAGFFKKLISFFKNLFGINRVIAQAFKSAL